MKNSLQPTMVAADPAQATGDAAVAARLPVRVAIRCRPPGPADGEPCVAINADGSTVIVHSGEEEATFSFDAAFASDAGQHDVYSELVAGPMAALFDGFNCTILAYGQTGSGKTHSMMGASDNDPSASPTHRARTAGMIPRFGAELFERAGKVQGAKITVSYAQLYNEAFSDLLDPSTPGAPARGTLRPISAGPPQPMRATRTRGRRGSGCEV